MRWTHARRIILVQAFLSFSICPFFATTDAQQPTQIPDDLAPALELLNKWDTKGAAKLLEDATKRDKSDMAAWHWLGITYERQAKFGDAREAHEKAARLGEALLKNQLDLAEYDSLDARLAKLKPQMALAVESADAFMRLSRNFSIGQRGEWPDRREFLHDYIDTVLSAGPTIYKSKDVTIRPQILSKPGPGYTAVARANGVTGTVVLRAIFASDGTVRAIYPKVGLPDGLTHQAINAARQIRFVPGMKDGRPVSIWMQLEYNFSLK